MSAKVEPNPFGGWIGYCDECNESIERTENIARLWADVHKDFCTGAAE